VAFFPRLMNRLVRVAVWVVSGVLGLEIGTRIDEWVRWKTPLTATAQSVADLIIIDSAGVRGVPGAQYRQFAINRAGLRGPEPRPGIPKVIVLGASETFGLYEPSGKEYARQLEDTLATAGCSVDILNAGLPGQTLPTQAVTYFRHLRALNPALVVLYPTPVQYLDEFRPAFNPPATPRLPNTRWRTRAFRRIRDHMKVVVPASAQQYLRSRDVVAQRVRIPPDSIYNTLPNARLNAYLSDLRSLVSSITATGVPVVVLSHANSFPPTQTPDTARLIAWAKFYPRASLNVLTVFDRVANDSLRNYLGGPTAHFVDLAASFEQSDPRLMFADFSHFTAAGSAQVAHVVARELLDRVGCPTLVKP
jgi:hypothetical protein